MKKCHVVYLVCTAAMIGTGLGAAPASSVPTTHVVHPGESIQKAVDAAESGDTVLVTPGTYRESVKVSTPGLTLSGMGRTTVIRPGTQKAADDTCAEGGNGICVIGTKDKNVKGVTVADLTVTGFTRTGVFSMATDGLTVRGVTTENNGVWGIAQERSVHGVIRGNTARDNGDAGIFLANTVKTEEGAADTEGTLVAHNRLEGNRIGVTVRRLRNLAVADNHITGNCAGVFVVGDENTPKAGDLAVRDNHVVRNNKSCPKTDRLEALQGSGIVLTGVEKVLVADNTVEGNSGKSSMSGGIVLAASMVGAANSKNEVNGNRLRENSPADLVDATSGDSAKSNTFSGNTCGASKPAGLC
ncbi:MULTISPECIES: right-handed parallel beta-helix repeat-containing protein [Streptomyces]|uniref:Right-handed parallel beta-helix repeat-containing protein n=1 Tax=Streptomyces olivaceus TaxID=47716 RepID=A0ABS7WCN0_STROV|nr:MULTISPECIES: right-handed parallel beta-helix repeat-containing protein [Streptomyces]MBZ6092804.1 right-handed parallel beta-helix repeat-containing protein [Streptomyces olivaceus]MBZ6099689.1 right-handed parallel beta-helix repeat-containing protein [Streptomyces olivaceus]MBZ6113617.1 right-handed parallel beta-helix repeat-containing protein [Streptomyces olivaceus]MBZ6120789.1 right-handed parallel beta-helix repeat-containing protein [Streptomyces olivaceus]MBZ6127468.1 right-hande